MLDAVQYDDSHAEGCTQANASVMSCRGNYRVSDSPGREIDPPVVRPSLTTPAHRHLKVLPQDTGCLPGSSPPKQSRPFV
jgi:hypothetical protein